MMTSARRHAAKLADHFRLFHRSGFGPREQFGDFFLAGASTTNFADAFDSGRHGWSLAGESFQKRELTRDCKNKPSKTKEGKTARRPPLIAIPHLS